VGEFAFVLLSLIGQLNILPAADTGIMMAVTALSMATTPLFLIVHDRFMVPRFGTSSKPEIEADRIEERNQVIIAGFSHFGSTVGRFLRANGVQATILDNDSDRVDLLRKMGFKVYYGDATRVDLLESAGAEHARVLVIAIDDPDTVFGLVQNIQRHFPHLILMTRARNRLDAYELLDLGVENIYREHLDSSIRLGVDVLKKLGHRSYAATRSGQQFRAYDEAAMRALASHRKDTKQYIMNVRQQIEQQEELLRNDRSHDPSAGDHAWDGEFVRETLTGGTK
jgi:CPA2 family monovalent cation:H+ antiporter-2